MKKILLPVLISFTATLVILILHAHPAFKSMIAFQQNKEVNEIFESSYLITAVDYHKEVFDFAKRPVSTFLIEGFSKITHASIGDSFVFINFLFLFFNGILLYLLSARHFTTRRNSLLNILIYYSSFAILQGFFPPVYSYDEPVQYFFIFLMLIFYFEKKYIPFLVFAFLAILARETSAFILIGIAFYHFQTQTFKLKPYIYFSIPVVLYIAYIFYFTNTHPQLIDSFRNDSHNRLTAFKNNFIDTTFSAESLFAVINTTLLPVYFLYIAIKNKRFDANYNKWIDAFLLVLLINMTVVYSMTIAREVRLFNLPMIMLYPFGYIVYNEIRHTVKETNWRILLQNWRFWICLTFTMFFVYVLSCKLFRPTLGIDSDNTFNEYCFVMLTVVGVHFLLRRFKTAGIKN